MVDPLQFGFSGSTVQRKMGGGGGRGLLDLPLLILDKFCLTATMNQNPNVLYFNVLRVFRKLSALSWTNRRMWPLTPHSG